MSSRAMEAFFNHAEGSDAEWRVMGAMADAADRRGVIAGISMAELAVLSRKTEKGASQIVGRIVESGQLVVLDEGGGRGKTKSYWLKLPGLPGPEVPEDEGTRRSGKNGRRSIPGTKRRSSSSSSKAAEFVEELRDAGLEGEDEIVTDAQTFLHDGRKVGGRLVSPREMALAAVSVAAYNRNFEWNGRKGAEVGLGSALVSVIGRIREHPTWDAAKHVRLVESAWRIRWWEKTGTRRPTPSVIWGHAGVFEQVAQDAKEEHEGKTVKVEGRRYTRDRR